MVLPGSKYLSHPGGSALARGMKEGLYLPESRRMCGVVPVSHEHRARLTERPFIQGHEAAILFENVLLSMLAPEIIPLFIAYGRPGMDELLIEDGGLSVQ